MLPCDEDVAGPVILDVEVAVSAFAKESLSSNKDEMSSVNFGVFEKGGLTVDTARFDKGCEL